MLGEGLITPEVEREQITTRLREWRRTAKVDAAIARRSSEASSLRRHQLYRGAGRITAYFLSAAQPWRLTLPRRRPPQL
jgi:hypothetical protein